MPREEGKILEWRAVLDFGRIEMADARIVRMTRAGLAAPPHVFRAGQFVTFTLRPSLWGPCAVDVRPAAAPERAP